MASARQADTLNDLQTLFNHRAVNLTIGDGTGHAASITHTGATDFIDAALYRSRSIQVVNGATNSFVATFEGSNDGATWTTLAYRGDSLAAYVTTGQTTVGSASAFAFFQPDDAFRYLRANVSSANTNGTTLNFYGASV